jgi:hypothetical protein
MYQIVEEESGTFVPRQHPHNGYYAGDFSAVHSCRSTFAPCPP